MDIRLEPRTAAHPKREEIERAAREPEKRELGRKRRVRSRFGVNLVVSVLVILPLLYALSIAFMPSGELFSMEMNLIPKQPTLDNFAQAFTKIPLFRFILNSFLVAGCITLGQIISCSLAAFALSFLDFKGKNVIFMLIMATMMVPGEATIISNYLTVSGWGWLNSYKVLIIPYITSAMGIFLFRQFYLTFPKSLYEAAKIDGCPNPGVHCPDSDPSDEVGDRSDGGLYLHQRLQHVYVAVVSNRNRGDANRADWYQHVKQCGFPVDYDGNRGSCDGDSAVAVCVYSRTKATDPRYVFRCRQGLT